MDRQHEHCWHTGSGADSASYGTDGGFSITHFICCHCGETKTERREWGPIQWPTDEKKHGEHTWEKERHTFESKFQ